MFSYSFVRHSAGIGRTGTYLALDILLTRAQHESEVDVFTCVWKLRQQRIHMVQTLVRIAVLPTPINDTTYTDQ